MENPTITPRLYRLDRPVATADLNGGAVTITLPEIQYGSMAELEQLTVAGPGLGGARVTAYFGRDDQVVPENTIGTVLLGVTDTATSFGTTRPWLFGPERVIVVVTGAGSGRVAVRAWQRVYSVDYAVPQPAAPPVSEKQDVAARL